jgi:hypothetical protein
MGMRRKVSPLPEGANKGYCYNPYDQSDAMTHISQCSQNNEQDFLYDGQEFVSEHNNLLHYPLAGQVAFYAFPEDAYPEPTPTAEKSEMSRLFFGQLPYDITDMEIAWLCGEFARGSQAFYNERILKKGGPVNKRMPTGCVHTYCDERDAELLVMFLNKRVLFDDSGIWYAENEEQYNAMHNYCQYLKANPACRPADRPYQPVVVQTAHSTYIPNLRQLQQEAAMSNNSNSPQSVAVAHSRPNTPPPPYQF